MSQNTEAKSIKKNKIWWVFIFVCVLLTAVKVDLFGKKRQRNREYHTTDAGLVG